MFTVLAIVKNMASSNRLINSFADNEIDWKMNVSSYDELQEELISSNIDLIVLDEKFFWSEEAEELIKRQNIDLVIFRGDFEKAQQDISKYINEYIEEFEKFELEEKVKNKANQSQQIKYIIQEEIKEVEKIVYKSRNIRQSLFCISTSDNNMIRDYYSCNIGALLGSLKDEKTVIVDMTKANNIVGYLRLSKERFFMVEKGVNAFTISKNLDFIYGNENLQLLRLDTKCLNKKYIKMILFALKDYENIIFVIDDDIELQAYSYILSIVNEVHLIVEPTIPTVRNTLNYIRKINELGQVNENIKVILSDLTEDSEIWERLFEKYSIYSVARNIYVDGVNKEQLISNRKEIETIKNILNLESSKKSFLDIFRR